MSLICENIISVGIGFDGALHACLAITDTMANPSQHVSADVVTFHMYRPITPGYTHWCSFLPMLSFVI